ncbi:GNAT family N-acetyltransferase [Domibacillus robiginosus]|uniref:GNAT family N-acetyltransferase n=1 Tax=Domibacillus robiginosus TaxID=1071054 RepID=UPI00067B9867|nr:GNAT family protein [Domibacillus robiginosus]
MIELAYFTREDFGTLMGWIPNEAFMIQWAGSTFTFPLHVHQLEQYIKGANQPISDTFVYKAIDQQTGQIMGHLSLQIDRRNDSARIGKVLIGEESARGKGMGLRLIEAAAELAFCTFKLHRVSLGVFDFNHAAISCYERAGFQREGLLRDVRKCGEEYWSLLEMSLLEEEWKRRM